MNCHLLVTKFLLLSLSLTLSALAEPRSPLDRATEIRARTESIFEAGDTLAEIQAAARVLEQELSKEIAQTSKETSPEVWASLKLSHSIILPLTGRTALSISTANEALSIYTAKQNPIEWGRAHLQLSANLDDPRAARESLERALGVLTTDADPRGHAQAKCQQSMLTAKTQKTQNTADPLLSFSSQASALILIACGGRNAGKGIAVGRDMIRGMLPQMMDAHSKSKASAESIVSMINGLRGSFTASSSLERSILAPEHQSRARFLRSIYETHIPNRTETGPIANEGWRALIEYLAMIPSSERAGSKSPEITPSISLLAHNATGLIASAQDRKGRIAIFRGTAAPKMSVSEAEIAADPFKLLRQGPQAMARDLAGDPPAAAWRKAYGRGTPEDVVPAIADFRATFEPAWAPVLFDAARAAGVKPGERLVLLADGAAATLPIGLLRDPKTGRSLIETFEVVFLPSAEFLSSAPGPARPLSPAVIVQDQTAEGPALAEAEGALVAATFGLPRPTMPQSAAAMVDRLAAGSIWHFATHGVFVPDAPLQSALLIKPTEREGAVYDPLPATQRLADLFSGPLVSAPPPRLVVLAACESGLTDLEGPVDEFVGLPAAFLSMGAQGVVGTLWQVGDLSTFLMMGRFYAALKAGAAPPAALRQAQLWLAAADVAALSAEMRGAVGGGAISEADAAPWLKAIAAAKGRPFSGPEHWGAFVYWGD